ncbi:MAG TPA: chemotaxis protein CheX [Bdellovibrionales bacterium]|nr:chemotaxis protein CheX [Bdellovibrionales bacterium]
MSGFKVEVNEKTSIISMPVSLTENEIVDFKKQINGWLLAPVDSFVIDFKNTNLIERQFYQVFLQFRAILKNNSKTVYSVNIRQTLLAQIKADGLHSAFAHVESVEAAREKVTSHRESKNNIDLEFIKPFLKGVNSALETQCNTPVRPQKPFVKTTPMENIAIAAVLSLNSDNLQGTVILSFPEAVFLKVYENMFDEKQTSITKESEDAAAELLNIIYGAAKVELNQKGYNFPKSLPTILRGQEIVIRQTSNATTVVIPFEGAGGRFYLEVECERN